jgi:hypothetical protein
MTVADATLYSSLASALDATSSQIQAHRAANGDRQKRESALG